MSSLHEDEAQKIEEYVRVLEEMVSGPVIWTSLGNFAVSDLVYETRWEKTDLYTKFIETYSLNGEVVKESAHILAHEGISSAALIPQI